MRLIDADALKKDLTRFYDNEVTARQLIDAQPTITPEPHWIPCSERMPEGWQWFYATCRSKVDDRENWVIEGLSTPWKLWGDLPPMVRAGDAKIIAWMPKELPEPWKGDMK